MAKQSAETGSLVERFNALPDVWFENELFEQTRDYLTRGRRFETVTDDVLNEKWAHSFRQFVRLHVGHHIREMADAGAELRLRGAGFPTHLVPSEVEQLQAAIRCFDPVAVPGEYNRKLDEAFVNEDDQIQ